MEEHPYEDYSEFLYTKERQILTYQEHGIPGLRMIGRNHTSHAAGPLNSHYHKNAFEFTYVVQGNISFRVDGADYPLSGGDLFVTFPNEVHSTGRAPITVHQMYWFQLMCDNPEKFLYMEPSTAQWLIDRLSGLPHRVIRMDKSIENSFREIFLNLVSGPEAGHVQAAFQLSSLLCQILKDAGESAGSISVDIRRAVDYIRKHLQEKITMEQLAETAHLSVSRLKQKFQAQVGTSPRSYINVQKIEASKKMILQGMSMTQVAMELGFSGSDYFSVVFRRYTSLSPVEYRDKMLAEQGKKEEKGKAEHLPRKF